MSDSLFPEEDLDRLLKTFIPSKLGLREQFEQSLLDRGVSMRSACDILGIQHRTLIGILDGKQKSVDILMLANLADFMRLTKEEALGLLFNQVSTNFKDELMENRKRLFILDNFDLTSLKKSGFLEDITDFTYIEERIVSYFELNSIFEYGSDISGVAFSSGKPKPKTKLAREFWIEAAAKNLKRINNYYDFDRAKLIEYIPSIRWHTMNVKNGLFQVIRDLFKLGVTIIFQPYISNIHVRGATFSVHDKPCIVITNYRKYYSSLWFTLMHELHHVLYDWDEINNQSYHISGELDLFSPNEIEADDFAREYLFSREKMNKVRNLIDNQHFILEYAKSNHVHPSIIYSFFCKDNETDEEVWKKYTKLIPDYSEAVSALANNPWQNRKSTREVVNQQNASVFDGI